MTVEILGDGAFSSALVHLAPGERFVSDSGALFRSSPNVQVDVTTRSKGKGGILTGLKRLVGGDTFFLSTYTVEGEAMGEVGLAPTLQGEVRAVELDGTMPWLCAGGSWLGASDGLTIDSRFQGFKGLFSGENVFFVHLSGAGTMLLSAFGRMTAVEVDGTLVVDTGHVVAFEERLSYRLSKAGASWFHSWLGGEGVVMVFEGRGRLLVQSHNPTEYGRVLGGLLPPRQG